VKKEYKEKDIYGEGGREREERDSTGREDVKELTESGDELNSSNNVCSKVTIDGTIGSIEDGNGVENDSIDSTELLKDHDCQTQNKRMPDLFGLQLGKERKRSTEMIT
jgi:hypothetical protein